MKYLLLILLSFIAFSFVGSRYVSARVIVTPSEVKTGSMQTFIVGVPNEKEKGNLIGVRIVIPNGVKQVIPNVKTGWSIGTNGGENTAELIWINGNIPPGQRDDFIFSAQVPPTETSLAWKAYQIYDDGTQISWDQRPVEGHEVDFKPYSETMVVNTLGTVPSATKPDENTIDNTQLIAYLAFLLAGAAIAMNIKNNHKK